MKMTGVRKGNKPGCHVRKAYAHGGRVHKANGGGISGGDEAAMFMDDDADQANMVDGVPVRQRLDRPAPKAAKSTSITINIAQPKTEPAAMPKLPPVVPPGLPPVAGQPPAPMMPPAGGPPMPMRANGGRVGRSEDDYKHTFTDKFKTVASDVKRLSQGKTVGSATQSETSAPTFERLQNKRIREGVTTPEKRANGGRVDMDAGAGGGLGRLEKVKDYGAKAGKPAKGK